MKLNQQQEDALFKALNWYFCDSYKKQLFTLCGLAGTGKSTCLKSIIGAMGLTHHSVLYVTFSGKASAVLRLKGLMAMTIHKAFYNAKPYKQSVSFKRKQTIPNNIKIIVIDEFSMVPDYMTNDILSFGVPILTLSDPGQLPPLYFPNTYVENEDKLDVFLTQVMRSSDASGILDLAMLARSKKPLRLGNYGDSRVVCTLKQLKVLSTYDKILSWTNKTRRSVNSLIRSELNITSRYPVTGEKIAFLANRYDKFVVYIDIELCIVNGLECIVLEDSEIINEYQILVKARPSFIDDPSIFFEVLCSRTPFDSYYETTPDIKTLMETDKSEERDSIYADFAYAATVSASQGSEWGNVLVIDEMPKWRPEYSKWLYTALTRASLSVDILVNQSL